MTDATQPPNQPSAQVEVIVPEAQSAGIYANGFGTWFNQTDFTLDYLVHLPANQEVNAEGQPVVRQPVQVVARVKFSPALIFRLIQTLNTAMTQYEQQFGTIVPLGEPIQPPQDDQPPAG